MDFIGVLPVSNGFNGIMVVVDRLTKYAQFVPLAYPYTTKSVARLFVEYVIRLHGFPSSVIVIVIECSLVIFGNSSSRCKEHVWK